MKAQVEVKQETLGDKVSLLLQNNQIQNPFNYNNISEQDKITEIAHNVKNILETLGFDTNDEAIKDTHMRVAKMYVTELCAGVSAEAFPKCTVFPNTGKSVVSQNGIPFISLCEHHLQPFSGTVNVTYQSEGFVIGLSKLNRIVSYFASRPQIQERFTK